MALFKLNLVIEVGDGELEEQREYVKEKHNKIWEDVLLEELKTSLYDADFEVVSLELVP